MQRFEGCRQRIKRADAHRKRIAELWNEAGEAEDLHSVVVGMNDDGTGEIWLKTLYGPDFIDAISLELGEALYQLRATLDGCVYQAAILESKKNPPPDENSLEFPVCISHGDFKKRTFKIAPLPDDLRALVEHVQPYNIPKNLAPDLMVFNVNRAIGTLSDWARKDRHRRLHVVGSYVVSATPKLRLPEGVTLESMRVAGAGLLVEQGKVAEFRLAGYRPGMEIQANPDAAIDIAVDEVPPPCADNDTLSNRIEAMFVATYCIVESFEETF
jgi:hypothetical protein